MPAFRTSFLYRWIPRNKITFRVIRAAVERAPFFRAFPADFAVAIRARAIHFGTCVQRDDGFAFGITRTTQEFTVRPMTHEHRLAAFRTDFVGGLLFRIQRLDVFTFGIT